MLVYHTTRDFRRHFQLMEKRDLFRCECSGILYRTRDIERVTSSYRSHHGVVKNDIPNLFMVFLGQDKPYISR